MSNFDLVEEIRAYWSDRAATFDLSAGHRIAPGLEADAWAEAIGARLGPGPLRVLELACGTGEITGILLRLGHEVTALDFSEAMLARAEAKHGHDRRVRFRLADAQNTMEGDGAFDAVVCRHLVWTLTDPAAAFAEWRRVLKPGGTLVIFDGDWARVTPAGRAAQLALALLDRWLGEDGTGRNGFPERHAAIMRQLPFGQGLRSEELRPMLEAAGFTRIDTTSQGAVMGAQRRGAPVRDRLRTRLHRRFALKAEAV